MPQFAYTARTRSGEKVNGAIDASDQRNALAKLDRLGYVPIMVKEGRGSARPKPDKKGNGAKPGGGAPVKGKKDPRKAARKKPATKSKAAPEKRGAAKAKKSWFQRRARMKPRDVLMFTRELSDLLASGMTLGSALNTLSQRKADKAQDEIVAGLRDAIVQGDSLSEALALYGDSFSPLYVNMVRAGEASGTLPEVLERLGEHYERVQEAKEKVVGALVYPLIILGVGLLTIVFIMVFVIPRFQRIFEELGAQLPTSTQILIALSGFLMRFWPLLLVLVAGSVMLFRRAVATDGGRRIWHGLQLRTPVVRNVIAANAFAQFARTLGTLLSNGVPVLSALSIVEETMSNQVIKDEINEARDRVTDGATISKPLAEGNVFPRLLTDMLAVGEESGDMSGSLGHIANRYSKELDRSIKVLTTVIEPVMILLMAVLVGFVAMSLLMAVFDMTSGLNM